ncbi:MAG: GNAT family N-acetyltransferase [Chloroflexota bacterium]|nr:GNAT family N-acetyltransferase [Anaerolineae bacterium]
MVTSTIERQRTTCGIRSFDITTDLNQLADLMELAFGQELQATENRIVQEMRQTARLGAALWLLERIAPIMHGFVYVEGERLVGNVTLSEDRQIPRQWIMSNVAVHPDYRGRGIARRLAERSLEWIGLRRGRRIRLQVRTDNAAAQALYLGMDFERYDTLSELSAQDTWSTGFERPTDMRRLTRQDWRATFDLALAVTPDQVRRIRPMRLNDFRRTRSQWLMENLFDKVRDQRDTHRLGLFTDKGLAAYLMVCARWRSGQHQLTALVHPDARGQCEDIIVRTALSILSLYPARPIFTTVSMQDRPLITEMERRGFKILRTLDQLVLDLGKASRQPARNTEAS